MCGTTVRVVMLRMHGLQCASLLCTASPSSFVLFLSLIVTTNRALHSVLAGGECCYTSPKTRLAQTCDMLIRRGKNARADKISACRPLIPTCHSGLVVARWYLLHLKC